MATDHHSTDKSEWVGGCSVIGHCIWSETEGARITLLQGGYFPDHIWWKPSCSIYLIDPRAGQCWAKARHLLTVFHSIFWVEIPRKAKPHFFFQPRGVGERHLNNGLSPWPPDWAQSYLVMYGAGNNYLLVHLFSGLWVTGNWVQIWSEENFGSIIYCLLLAPILIAVAIDWPLNKWSRVPMGELHQTCGCTCVLVCLLLSLVFQRNTGMDGILDRASSVSILGTLESKLSWDGFISF